MPTRPAVFRSKNAPTRAEVDKDRGSARERGYTTQWDRTSRAYLSAHPLCVGCEAVGWVRAATLTDHVVPHRGNQSLFWSPTNRQSACQPHHDRVKKRLEAMFEAGAISADALRLDSPEAKRLTLALMG